MFITKKHLSRRTVLKGAGQPIALPLLDAMSPAGVAWAQTAAGRSRSGWRSSAFRTVPSCAAGRPSRRARTTDDADPRAAREVSRAHDDRLGPAQQAGREPRAARASSSARGCRAWRRSRPASTARMPASRRIRSRCGTSVRRRGCRRSSSRRRCAARSSRGARRRSRCRRRSIRATCSTGCSVKATRSRARGDRPGDGQHPRPRHGAGGRLAGEARRQRPRRPSTCISTPCARSSAACRWRATADTSSARHPRRADRRAERPRRALQADVRPDGARVPGGSHARHHVLDGPRSEHADVQQLEHLRSVPSALASRQRSRRSRTGSPSIQNYHTKMFARFIERLAKTPEGDGSLLDHSMILFGSNMSDSNRHNNDPLPSAVLGSRARPHQGRPALAAIRRTRSSRTCC